MSFLWFVQFPLWTSVIVGVLQTCKIISESQAPTNLLLEPVNVMCNLIGADKVLMRTSEDTHHEGFCLGVRLNHSIVLVKLKGIPSYYCTCEAERYSSPTVQYSAHRHTTASVIRRLLF